MAYTGCNSAKNGNPFEIKIINIAYISTTN